MKVWVLKEQEEQEKYNWFVERTNRHIELVKKAVEKIVSVYPEFKALLGQVKMHDASKFEEPEKTPYIEISWKYKLADGGKILSTEEENKATLHHVLNNSHHPEYWLEDRSEANLSAECRDESTFCVDASRMPDLDVAEMVADWQAMSEELQKNEARDWFNKQKDVRWSFSKEQEQLIDRLLKVFE